CGGRFTGAGDTVIENGGRFAVLAPSVTEMPMPEYNRALPTGGVPASRPVVVSKLAQAGLLTTAKVRAWRSASLAVGWNEYACCSSTLVAGVPEMIGAAPADTRMPNRLSDT